MAINWQIEQFDCLPSTQDYLKELAYNNPDLPEGSLICATEQTQGHGRHGRAWLGGEGNLYLSFLIRAKCNINDIGQLSLLTGLALSRAIEQDIILKWPNDVLIQDKKCCGILIDAAPVIDNKIAYLIIGIGVNIKSAPLETSTCLGKSIDKNQFMDRVLSAFSDCYEQWKNEGFTDLREEWLSQTCPKGQKISVKIGSRQIKGSFERIDMLGNLILICDNTLKEIEITSGEVICC